MSLGASPRGAVHLLAASKAAARLAGRDFVTPDDVVAVAPAVLRHRLQLRPGSRARALHRRRRGRAPRSPTVPVPPVSRMSPSPRARDRARGRRPDRAGGASGGRDRARDRGGRGHRRRHGARPSPAAGAPQHRRPVLARGVPASLSIADRIDRGRRAPRADAAASSCARRNRPTSRSSRRRPWGRLDARVVAHRRGAHRLPPVVGPPARAARPRHVHLRRRRRRRSPRVSRRVRGAAHR